MRQYTMGYNIIPSISEDPGGTGDFWPAGNGNGNSAQTQQLLCLMRHLACINWNFLHRIRMLFVITDIFYIFLYIFILIFHTCLIYKDLLPFRIKVGYGSRSGSLFFISRAGFGFEGKISGSSSLTGICD